MNAEKPLPLAPVLLETACNRACSVNSASAIDSLSQCTHCYCCKNVIISFFRRWPCKGSAVRLLAAFRFCRHDFLGTMSSSRPKECAYMYNMYWTRGCWMVSAGSLMSHHLAYSPPSNLKTRPLASQEVDDCWTRQHGSSILDRSGRQEVTRLPIPIRSDKAGRKAGQLSIAIARYSATFT